MKKPGVKAFVVYNKKLLLILRDDNPNISFPNTWNLPGGGIDENEDGLEAITRELKEEIAIVPQKIISLGKQIFGDGSEVFRYLIYLTREEYSKVKLGEEGQKLKFFSVDEISKLSLAGYSKEYFFTYSNQIKEIVEKNSTPNPKLLGLTM